MEDLRLLMAYPLIIEPNAFMFYPPTIKDISLIGEGNYRQYVSWLTLSEVDIETRIEEFKNQGADIFDKPCKNIFEFLLKIYNITPEMNKFYTSALKFFTKEKFLVLEIGETSMLCIEREEKAIPVAEDSFLDFIDLLLSLNNMPPIPRPKSDAERRLMEKFKERKEILAKKEKNSEKLDSPGTSLATMVSVVAAKFQCKPSDIGDMTIYEFYNIFKRLQMIETFEIQMQNRLQGSKEKVNHYIKEIKT